MGLSLTMPLAFTSDALLRQFRGTWLTGVGASLVLVGFLGVNEVHKEACGGEDDGFEAGGVEGSAGETQAGDWSERSRGHAGALESAGGGGSGQQRLLADPL